MDKKGVLTVNYSFISFLYFFFFRRLSERRMNTGFEKNFMRFAIFDDFFIKNATTQTYTGIEGYNFF